MRRFCACLGIFLLSALFLAGGVSPLMAAGDSMDSAVFKDGDAIQMKFTCRDKDGLVTATTEKSITDDPSIKKSSIFFPKKGDAPVISEAGKKNRDVVAAGHGGYESEIIYQLARLVVGKRPGEIRKVTLKDEFVGDAPEQERLVTLALVRVRTKEVRMTRKDYLDRKRVDPKVGVHYADDSYYSGAVSAVTDSEVVISFAPKYGSEVETPFGKGIIVDAGDKWETRIQAKVGQLVRTGSMVGIIIEVGDKNFVVDYGRPLAGQSIDCDVDVQAAGEAPKQAPKP